MVYISAIVTNAIPFKTEIVTVKTCIITIKDKAE